MIQTGFRQAAVMISLVVVSMMVAVGFQGVSAQTPAADGPDLAAVKQYVTEQTAIQKTAAEQLVRFASRYHVLAEGAGFDFQALWESNMPETAGLLAAIKAEWIKASTAYEMTRAVTSSSPALADFEKWIGSGPSRTQDAEAARKWSLKLPDGTEIEQPGNILHDLTEPMIWGSVQAYVGGQADLNADDIVGPGEVLPEAKLLLASTQALDEATAGLQTAIESWEPQTDEIVATLATLSPTTTLYLEQWKQSVFVTGDEASQVSFVAQSRLTDLAAFSQGLAMVYASMEAMVEAVDPGLNSTVVTGFTDLKTMLEELSKQETGGTPVPAEATNVAGDDVLAQVIGLAEALTRATAILTGTS